MEAPTSRRVESSLLEGLVGVLGLQAAKYFATGERPEATGNDHPMLSPFGTFKTKDGRLIIAAGYQNMWERFAKALNLEALINDERFLRVGDRVKNNSELTRIIEERLIGKTNKEWEEILNEAGVPNGPILHIDEVFQHEQVLHQEMLMEMIHPVIGRMKMIGFPTKLSRTPASARFAPPGLGEHTEDVLQGLGYSPQHIKEMRDNGIL